jgi:putative transposase
MDPKEPNKTGSTASSSPAALFRYQVISLVLTWMLSGQPRADAVRRAAGMTHPYFDGRPRKVSPRTIYRWLSEYQARGIAGLEPVSRQKQKNSEVLSAKFLSFLAEQKDDDPRASLPELIRRARELGVVGAHERVDRSTVWRVCRRLGVYVQRRKKQPDRDTRRFAYPHRMDMVLCDGKHFRAGATRAKRVALFFLDDCSRYGLHVVVGTSESARLFLRGLYECIRQAGLMAAMYLDQGPGFIAEDTVEVFKNMGAWLIHGEEAYPEGHGKIEKFNQTAKAAILRGLDRRPDVDPACSALELRLQHYLREVYNHIPHSSLGMQTPAQRFAADRKPLCFPEDDKKLRSYFVVDLRRRVSGDHIVSIDSVLYEMPRGYAGCRVTLHRNVLSDSLGFLHQGKMIELKPVDLAANARDRRGRARRSSDDEVARPPPRSAADLIFERDLSPVVGPDGGFINPPKREEEK